MTPESLARELGGARHVGAEWQAYCPIHEADGGSHKPSLGITERNGVVVWKCRRGCDQELVTAAIHERGLFNGNGRFKPAAPAKPAEEKIETGRQSWTIRDIGGNPIAKHLRISYGDGSKDLPWFSIDDRKGLDGRPPASLPLYGMEHIAALPDGARLILVEGEKTADALCRAGFIAAGTVTGAKEKAGDVHSDDVLIHLIRLSIVLWPDNDTVGRAHMHRHAERLLALGATDIRVVNWADAPVRGDAADFEGPDEGLLALIETATPFDPNTKLDNVEDRSPWPFVNADEFLAQGSGNDDADFLIEELAVRGGITILSAVRGLAKTHVAHAAAIAVARGGLFAGRPVKQGRVAIIDRDNPPREIRRRLRKWGAAGLGDRLKVITRDRAASLTDHKAWAQFPAEDFDLIILDSLGSAMEGVSEQEGGESGKTIAPLLDIARRGPAVLILTNTTKDAAKIRGSGVIPDRVEIVYELRDATAMKLDAKKESWTECLPPAGEHEWLNRSSRRKRRDNYRLSFHASKYRVSGEGNPFVLEVRLPDDGEWEVARVTDLIEAEHENVRRSLEDSLIKRGKNARAELERRIAEGATFSKTQAEELLRNTGLKRDEAREAVDEALQDGTFAAEPDEAANGRGVKPKILKLVKEQPVTV